jgi:hypothetical protein
MKFPVFQRGVTLFTEDSRESQNLASAAENLGFKGPTRPRNSLTATATDSARPNVVVVDLACRAHGIWHLSLPPFGILQDVYTCRVVFKWFN